MKFFRALLKLLADESLKELLACVLGDTSGEGVDGNLVKTELFSNPCPKWKSASINFAFYSKTPSL